MERKRDGTTPSDKPQGPDSQLLAGPLPGKTNIYFICDLGFNGIMSEDGKKNKHDFLLHLLEKGDAMVCLDARKEGVDVPKSHKNNAALNLVFNLNFKRPLHVTEEDIVATLGFQGRPHPCVIPFDAVWAIFAPDMSDLQVWEESIPQDVTLAAEMFQNAPKKGNLKAVTGDIPACPAPNTAENPRREKGPEPPARHKIIPTGAGPLNFLLQYLANSLDSGIRRNWENGFPAKNRGALTAETNRPRLDFR